MNDHGKESLDSDSSHNEQQTAVSYSRSARRMLGLRSASGLDCGLEKTLLPPGRAEDLLVLELCENGKRRFMSLSIRALYKYTLATIMSVNKPVKEAVQRTETSPDLVEEKDQTSKADQQVPQKSSNRLGKILRKASTFGHVVTRRERLGNYLHPRDMRRLATSFSVSNEPELMVRRHVMLLSFDPIRAIILRDRLLVIVLDGSDSIIEKLEARILGGEAEVEHSIFGDSEHDKPSEKNSIPSESSIYGKNVVRKNAINQIKTNFIQKPHDAFKALKNSVGNKNNKNSGASDIDMTLPSKDVLKSADLNVSETETVDALLEEWEELNGNDWVKLPFELQCVDAILHIVCSILFDDTYELQELSFEHIGGLIERKKQLTVHGDPLSVIRQIKNSTVELQSRIKSSVQFLTEILDNDEDMALMNLSRLLTHPERFIRPVSEEILQNESVEPELIMEAHLQSVLTLQNCLNLIQGQITTASNLLDQKSDSVQNRILFANIIISVASLCITVGGLVGSLLGTNLNNHIETDPKAFMRVTTATTFGMIFLMILIMAILHFSGTTPTAGLNGV